MQALWSGGDLGSDTAFDTVNAGTGATTTVGSTAQAAHGTRSLYTVTTGTSSTAYGAWSTAHGSIAAGYYRSYGYLGSLPGVERTVARWMGAGLQRARLVWTSGQKLILRDSANNIAATGTTNFPAATWLRCEPFITFTTTGAAAVRIYASIDAGKASYTELLTVVSGNFGGNCDEVRWGAGAAATNAPDLWLDDIGATDTTWLGPARETITITGISVPLTLGSPAQAQALTVAPGGIAVPLTLGGPALAHGAMTISPGGIAVPVAVGDPALAQALTIVPTGIAVPTATGTPAVAQSLGVTPAGIAVSVTFGDPALATVAEPAPGAILTTIGPPGIRWHAGKPTARWTADPPATAWTTGRPIGG